MKPARRAALSLAFPLAFTLAVTGAAAARAWIAEDAFVTLRHVGNALAGYGPVFNVGERVQGFSHPLWFLVVLAGSRLADPVLVCVALGLLFTAAGAFLFARRLLRSDAPLGRRILLLALAAAVLLSSDPWLSFQTGGLENALSHLLLGAALVLMWDGAGARVVPFLLALLCMTRPDFLLLALPIAAALLWRDHAPRALGTWVLAALAPLAWVGFAWRFYGDPVPNTAYAKLGIYRTAGDVLAHGLAYVADSLAHDTVAALAATLLLALAAARARSIGRVACLAALGAHLAWVLVIGGDFMRGRFLLPLFTGAVVLGCLALAERMPSAPVLAAAALVVAIAGLVVGTAMDAGISESGIVNERAFYPGYSLAHYLRTGSFESPYLDSALPGELRAYAGTCGAVTIHTRNPGTIGYLAGPRVTVIDLLGLTDRTIAKLPRRFLVQESPRPGHPAKRVPFGYLASRGDVSLVPGWRDAVRRRDCALRERIASVPPPASGGVSF